MNEVSKNFDDYWNSEFAVPAEAVIGNAEGSGLDTGRARLATLVEEAMQSRYAAAVRKSVQEDFSLKTLKFDNVNARLYSDPPSKAAGGADGEPILASQLVPCFQRVERSVNIVSAYLVPRRKGVEWLSELEDKGVDVRVVTNSLASNDVAPRLCPLRARSARASARGRGALRVATRCAPGSNAGG